MYCNAPSCAPCPLILFTLLSFQPQVVCTYTRTRASESKLSVRAPEGTQWPYSGHDLLQFLRISGGKDDHECWTCGAAPMPLAILSVLFT